MPLLNHIIDLKQVESSPTEPLTLQQVKDHLIITFSDDDALLTRFITQCRWSVESYCNISIVAKTITLLADLYQEWELPLGPVTGIQSVATRSGTQGSGPATYETAASNWQTQGTEFLSFVPFGGSVWDWGPPIPSNYPGCGDRYRLIYTTGYNIVPDDLKLAILNEISYRYEHRGNEENVIYSESAQALAFPYKRMLWL